MNFRQFRIFDLLLLAVATAIIARVVSLGGGPLLAWVSIALIVPILAIWVCLQLYGWIYVGICSVFRRLSSERSPVDDGDSGHMPSR